MNNRNTLKKRNNHQYYPGLRSLQRTLDNFFAEPWWPESHLLREEWQPHSKFAEDENNYYLEVDLPGVKKADIKVELLDNNLRLQAERKEKHESKKTTRHYTESFYGSFRREFTLPNSVDKKHIKAQHEDGVLFLTIPKSVKSESQEISIS